MLLVACCVCALPWTPLWNVVLDVGYLPLCLLGVDHWFSAKETLVLSDGTGADLSAANDPARQKEVERAEWLCGTYRFSSDFNLWVDDSGSGQSVRIRAEAWSPDRARDLVRNVVDKYRTGEGPSAATQRPAEEPHAESAEDAEFESHAAQSPQSPNPMRSPRRARSRFDIWLCGHL